MQTSTAISRSAAAALTDGGTAKDRHVLPTAATKRFDAILHVIEIVLRDMPNADPATRVALARLTEALARIVEFAPKPQESLRDFTRRLAAHMDVLPPAARALIEKQLNQQPLLAALKMLVETLRPALVLDLRIELPLTRDDLWHPDPASAVFPDPDEQPAFRQPTIQVPLPTRMAFSQAPGVAPGAPHLQQALGQAFSPETTLRRPDVSAPYARPMADAPDAVGSPPHAADGPVPTLREAAAFLASDAQALAQAVAIAKGQPVDVLPDRIADHPAADEHQSDKETASVGIEAGNFEVLPETVHDEAKDTRLATIAMPEAATEVPDAPRQAHREPTPAAATTAGTRPATEDLPLHAADAGPDTLKPVMSATGAAISKAELSVLPKSGSDTAGLGQMPTGAEAASAILQPQEAGPGRPLKPPAPVVAALLTVSIDEAGAAKQHVDEPSSDASGPSNPARALGSPQTHAQPSPEKRSPSFFASPATAPAGPAPFAKVEQPFPLQPILSNEATSGQPPPPDRAHDIPAEHQQTSRGATPPQMPQTAASPPPLHEAEFASMTMPTGGTTTGTTGGTTAIRLAPHETESRSLAAVPRPDRETMTFRLRPTESEPSTARRQQQTASSATSSATGETAGDMGGDQGADMRGDRADRSSISGQERILARRPGAFPRPDRSEGPYDSGNAPTRGLDHVIPNVEIAVITAGVRDVAHTIGQLDEWETLFYMLSGSLAEISDAPPPPETDHIRDSQQEATGRHSSASHSVESDLLTVIDEDRTALAASPHAHGEEALPASLLPKGMEAVLAREAIGYPFVPYLPVADAGSVEIEDEEARRQRRESEAGFAESEADENDGRGSGSSREHEEASRPEQADEDSERHDAYDLYQRLSDLP